MYYTIGGEIYHHGILGMKWGKRNGPPYPLGASAHSASERKAGYKKSIGGGRNESEYNRNKRSNRNYRSNNQNRKPKSTSQKVANVFDDVSKKNAKNSAKKAAAAAMDMTVAVAAAAVTSAVVLNMVKKGKVDAAQVVAKYAKVGVQQLKKQAIKGAAVAAFTLTTAAAAKGVSMTAKAVDANKKKSNKSKVDFSQGGLISDMKQKSEQKKQEKATKKQEKQQYIDSINKMTSYSNDYDDSPEGKKKQKQYEKALSRIEYEDTDSWSKSDWDKNFNKIEEDYLRSSQRYQAQQYAKNNGEDALINFVSKYTNKTVNTYQEALKAYEDLWHVHAI